MELLLVIFLFFFFSFLIHQISFQDFELCLYALETDNDFSNNCFYNTNLTSTVEVNLVATVQNPSLFMPAQLDSPPVILKITNNGPSDASDVLISSDFTPTVSVITVLPLSSENLGTVSAGQTSSLSYYLKIPASPNTTYPGFWTTSKSGYFKGNFNVSVSGAPQFSPISLNFTSNVDYVCHNHLTCESCLSDAYLLCGFCQNTKTCHPGKISYGPGENKTDCIAWDYASCQPKNVVNVASNTFNNNPNITIPSFNIQFDPTSQNFTFAVTLDYVRGASWVLDFQSLDQTRGLTPPTGSCANRRASDFDLNNCCNSTIYWRSAPSAAQTRNIQKGVYPSLGTTIYLAYPPPG